MINISQIKGFKYPDIELVRWFFKQSFDKLKNAKVLEFASHNGNNLSLFANYDYECIGVDINAQNIENANYNFQEDILKFPLQYPNIQADIFLIPNVINYLSRENFIKLLEISKENKMYKNNALFFLRTRSIRDYRYGLDLKIGENCFKITNDDTTGELGCINTLYQEHELIYYLKHYLALYDFKVLNYDSTNIMGKDERLVYDSDIVIYGKIQ